MDQSGVSKDTSGRTRASKIPIGPAKRSGKNGEASGELHDLLNALHAMREGDFSVRILGRHEGIAGRIADAFNAIVAANERIANQLEHVGEVVGKEGRTRQRVRFGLSAGAWGGMENSVNGLIDDLLWPTTEVTHAIGAVARGDLLQTVSSTSEAGPSKASSCDRPTSSTG